MYAIQGIQKETYEIEDMQSMDHLPLVKASLIKTGREATLYTMRRVIAGTKKRPASTLAYRIAGTDQFVTLI